MWESSRGENALLIQRRPVILFSGTPWKKINKVQPPDPLKLTDGQSAPSIDVYPWGESLTFDFVQDFNYSFMQSSWRESRSLTSREIYRLIATCEMIRTHSCHGCSLGQITSLAKGASERSIWMREKKQTGAIDFSPVGSTSLGFWLTQGGVPSLRPVTVTQLASTHIALSYQHPFSAFQSQPIHGIFPHWNTRVLGSVTACYASPCPPWLCYFVSLCGSSTCPFQHLIIEDFYSQEWNISTFVLYKSPVVHLLKSMKAEINWHHWKM